MFMTEITQEVQLICSTDLPLSIMKGESSRTPLCSNYSCVFGKCNYRVLVIGLCWVKVKVTVGVQNFPHLPQYKM